MTFKPLIVTAITASLAVPTAARADLGDVVKLGIGVAAVCAISGKCGNGGGQARAATPQRQAPRADESVRTDQSALNYFGFPAGSADGRMGSKTRNAIGSYQAYMGYPSTGQLTDYERSTLWGAYNRAQAGGGVAYNDVVAAEGTRGLIKAFAAEARGERYYPNGGMGQQPGSNGYVGNAAYPGVMGNQQQPAPMPAPVPVVETPPAAPSLPSFAQKPSARSMADHCRSVEILTQANGRMMEPGSVTDPAQALDEQFCGARGYSISRTQQLSADLQGVSDAKLQSDCEGLVPTMAAQTGALSTQDPEAMQNSVASYVSGFGMSPEQLVTTGEICLGIGYKTDNPEVVLASAMLLVGAGAMPYAEVFGHQLRHGFGTQADMGAATAWYHSGLDALDAGATPAFMPAQSTQRAAVIRAALNGGDPAAAGGMNASAPAGIPVFGASNN